MSMDDMAAFTDKIARLSIPLAKEFTLPVVDKRNELVRELGPLLADNVIQQALFNTYTTILAFIIKSGNPDMADPEFAKIQDAIEEKIGAAVQEIYSTYVPDATTIFRKNDFRKKDKP